MLKLVFDFSKIPCLKKRPQTSLKLLQRLRQFLKPRNPRWRLNVHTDSTHLSQCFCHGPLTSKNCQNILSWFRFRTHSDMFWLGRCPKSAWPVGCKTSQSDARRLRTAWPSAHEQSTDSAMSIPATQKPSTFSAKKEPRVYGSFGDFEPEIEMTSQDLGCLSKAILESGLILVQR